MLECRSLSCLRAVAQRLGGREYDEFQAEQTREGRVPTDFLERFPLFLEEKHIQGNQLICMTLYRH